MRTIPLFFFAIFFLVDAIFAFYNDAPVIGVVFLLGMVYFIWMAITEIDDNKPAFDPKKYKSKFVDDCVKAATQPPGTKPVIKSEKTLADVVSGYESSSKWQKLYGLDPSLDWDEHYRQKERWKQLHEIAGGEFKNNRSNRSSGCFGVLIVLLGSISILSIVGIYFIFNISTH